MKKLIFLMCLMSYPVFSKDQIKFTPELNRLVNENFDTNFENKDDFENAVQNFANEADLLPRKFIRRSTKIPMRPDEIKACVTRTKTICTGEGKDKSCETIEWEVCVSSD